MSFAFKLKIDSTMRHSPFVVVLCWFALAKSNELHNINTDSSLAITEDSNTVYPEKWISDLFYQALANFTVRNVGSAVCQKQGEIYDNNLRNYTNWAVKMAESWDRRPIGILTGNRYHFGVYDECVNVNYPIKGQYCLSEVKLMPKTRKNYSSNQTENLDRVYNSHSWKTILEWTNFSDRFQRNVLFLGICIPDTCTASDLQSSLQQELNTVFLPENVNAVVKVDQIMCTVKDNLYPYDTGFYITCAFFGLLVTICCGTTIYHFKVISCNRNETGASENLDSIFYSFSFIKSIKELLTYDKEHELNHIHGFKVVTMLFILFGHRFLFLAESPIVYTIPGEDIYSSGPDLLLTSFNNLVDPFFYLSGFLLSISLAFHKSGPVWMKLALPIINRIMRMLPGLCAVIVITVHIIPHLGDGPLWPLKIWKEAEICKNYWWTNLLFINNFIDIKYQCLPESWYVSCDIQIYVIGIIIAYVYTNNIKYGIGVLITMIGLSLSVPFLVTLSTKSIGILKIDIPFIENFRDSVPLNESYRQSYMRAAPFLIGLAMGFVIIELKKIKFKLSQSVVYGGTFCITVISVWIQLYGVKFYSRERPYYPLEHALYSVFSHCTWPMIGSWISICHFTTGYGLLMKLLSNRICVVLGRLSYSVFLVNFSVFRMTQWSQRTAYHLSVKSALDEWINGLFKSYLASLILYLIVEAPFGNISKKLLRRWKQKNSNTIVLPDENLRNNETKESDLKLTESQTKL